MGLGPNWSTGTLAASNPIPTDFELIDCISDGIYTMARVKYHGCTNHEGNKILLFLGDKEDYLHDAESIDPHFLEGSDLVARLAPTKQGLEILDKLMKF